MMCLKYTVKINNYTAKRRLPLGYDPSYLGYHTWQYERSYCQRGEYRAIRRNNYFYRDVYIRAIREMTNFDNK